MTKDNLEAILNNVNRFINIDSDRQQYTGHFEVIKNKIFAELRKQQPFAYLFNGWLLGGSYADNLKVKLPDEFDMIFHITFPENKLIDVEEDPSLPGNVRLNFSRVLKKIAKEKQHEKILPYLKKWVNNCNYLLVEKLQSYIQSCFTTALLGMNREIMIDNQLAELKYTRQGPAHTITVDGKYLEYSVDFVPGILLSKSQSVCLTNKNQWEAIPKPAKDNRSDYTSFRSSFSSEERQILNNKKNLKNALRMMKKFRDSHQNMNKMKSYFIKTLFLWKDKQESYSYWQKSLTEIIVDMFRALEKSLIDRELPFFWDIRLNMYEYSRSLFQEMLGCVKSARQTLEQAAQGLTPALELRVYRVFLIPIERLTLESATIEESFEIISLETKESEKSRCSIQ